jgi:hypothetical protein
LLVNHIESILREELDMKIKTKIRAGRDCGTGPRLPPPPIVI